MASKTVYIFFYSEEHCLNFADKHAERILHMGYGAFAPFSDESKQGTTEADDCTDKNRWFVRITLDDSENFLTESSTVADSSSLKSTSLKTRRRVSGV